MIWTVYFVKLMNIIIKLGSSWLTVFKSPLIGSRTILSEESAEWRA